MIFESKATWLASFIARKYVLHLFSRIQVSIVPNNAMTSTFIEFNVIYYIEINYFIRM